MYDELGLATKLSVKSYSPISIVMTWNDNPQDILKLGLVVIFSKIISMTLITIHYLDE